MEPAVLRSERLLLSIPAGADDIAAVARYCQDSLFERFLTTPWPYTRTHAETFVERFVPAGWSDDSEYSWAIRSAAGATSSTLMGMISWRTRGDVGFWMGAEHRGAGFMIEALSAVCDWVFSVPLVDGLLPQRIEWETFPGNVASARVAKAAGFRYQGISPVLVPARDGSHPDGWHGVLLPDDDREVKEGWPL